MKKMLLKLISNYELIEPTINLSSATQDFTQLLIDLFNLNVHNLVISVIAFAMMVIIAFYGYLCPYSFLNLALMDKYQLSSSQDKYR